MLVALLIVIVTSLALFLKVFGDVLEQLVGVLDSEQSFCRTFFHINNDPSSATDLGDYLVSIVASWSFHSKTYTCYCKVVNS